MYLSINLEGYFLESTIYLVAFGRSFPHYRLITKILSQKTAWIDSVRDIVIILQQYWYWAWSAPSKMF